MDEKNELTIEEAYKMLEEAPRKNKELWVSHSVNVAIVVERLAENLGLDSKRAYVFGLIHDIGRGKKEHTGIRHIIDGYNYLMKLGYEDEARICLTHTFYDRSIVKGNLTKRNTNLTRAEIKFIEDFINKTKFNLYDKILQIADNMGSATGINTIERRRAESMLRYGISHVSEKNLKTIFAVQNEIEIKLGRSIYSLFPEVTDNINKTMIKDVMKFLK